MVNEASKGVSIFVGLVAVLIACASEPRTKTSYGATRTNAASRVSLMPADAEIWSWTFTVRGAARSPERIQRCVLMVNGRTQLSTGGPESFFARVKLRAGTNTVQAVCRDREGLLFRSRPAQYRAMLRDRPTSIVTLKLEPPWIELDGRRSTSSRGSEAPVVFCRWFTRSSDFESWQPLGDGRELRVRAPAADGEYSYRLEVVDDNGERDVSVAALQVRGGALRLLDGRTAQSSWMNSAIVYGIIPPLFGRPPLQAVARSLSDLANLGVTAIWLSPIFATTPDDFGYAVTNYFQVRPDYGSERDLAALVREAHRLGVRVLSDFVPNHTSAAHPYFRDARRLGNASHYFSFYQRDVRGRSTHYFDWEHLPNLNYDHGEVQRFMLEAFGHWLRSADLDGFRVDAAWGIKQRNPGFWPTWASSMRRIKPAAMLLAEASALDDYYLTHGFDAAYDWTQELGHWAWRDVFDDPKQIVQRLDVALQRAEQSGESARIFRFLNNNDTGAQFITRHGVSMTRVAAAALLTLPGIPCIYTGEERGAEYEPYQTSEPLQPGDPHGLRPWYQALIRLRREHPSLHGKGFRRVILDPERQVYGYLRTADRETALVLLNFSKQPADIDVPSDIVSSTGQRQWREVLAGESIPSRTPVLHLRLPAWTARILIRASD